MGKICWERPLLAINRQVGAGHTHVLTVPSLYMALREVVLWKEMLPWWRKATALLLLLSWTFWGKCLEVGGGGGVWDGRLYLEHLNSPTWDLWCRTLSFVWLLGSWSGERDMFLGFFFLPEKDSQSWPLSIWRWSMKSQGFIYGSWERKMKVILS